MNNCKNCGKAISENKWCCNESCGREYYKKKSAEHKAELPNVCKNCFKPIPESLHFCSKSCLDELKSREKNASLFGVRLATKGLVYTDVDNLFTLYANSTGKERERLGKMMDDNYKLCKEYIEVVRTLREKNPNLRKFSLVEWLKWRNIPTKKTGQTNKEILSHA
jgi:predicted nucleic acid-binding Zn ribbon protein